MVMKSLSSLRDCTTRASSIRSRLGMTSSRSRSSCEKRSVPDSLHRSYSASFQTASFADSASPPPGVPAAAGTGVGIAGAGGGTGVRRSCCLQREGVAGGDSTGGGIS